MALTYIRMSLDDFEARSPDELSLTKGDRIELIERDDDFGDGWYLGRHMQNGRTGLFPEVYTTSAPRGNTTFAATSNTRPLAKLSINKAPQSSMQNGRVPTSVSPVSSVDETPQPIRPVGGTEYFNPHSIPPQRLDTTPPLQAAPNTMPAVTAPLAPVSAPRAMTIALSNQQAQGEDSPVMNETLSVIDEHITDMHTPRHSVIVTNRRGTNDSGSEYSSHLDHRLSYIAGQETDEEEQATHTKAEVLGWTPEHVAKYLGGVGVESQHCEVFREQEISGEVLLGMDQASIFMKEFDLGLVGRRLRTWHKIKALQEEVKNPKPEKVTPYFANNDDSSEELDRERNKPMGTVLPRIPSLMEKPGLRQQLQQSKQQQQLQEYQPVRNDANSPLSFLTSTSGQNSPRRPSAASIRDLNHSRRHSSIDMVPGMDAVGLIDRSSATSPINPLATSHRKLPSFDREWTMGGALKSGNGRPVSSKGTHNHSSSLDRTALAASPRNPSISSTSPRDLDRGYFSGGEVEGRRTRNVLRKRDTTNHSRNSSYTEETRRRSGISQRRQSRLSEESARETLSPNASPVSKGNSWKDRFRPTSEATRPMPPPKDILSPISPPVTKLDYTNDSTIGLVAPSTNRSSDVSSSEGGSLTSPPQIQKIPKVSRAMGLRAISDAVTGNEKALLQSPPESIPSPIRESPLQSPLTQTGSSTPSGTSKSFEIEPTNTNKLTTNGAPIGMASTSGTRRKTKRATSAYIRGLEKKSPQDQMIGCDYSGWMKKKSSNLMTTWKPRLFVLRGRRLSYYYSETDKQEKGLIDISSHRVLPADNDRITGLHATLTGASNSPTSPQNALSTIASTEAAAQTESTLQGKPTPDSMFIFKLVPPRAGLSRAVNFTKPTVHYFAVDNIQQGRLWMAALMKATIDRDESKSITTTYQQKTISLAKARAMKHRPPALMGLEEKGEKEEEDVLPTPRSDQTGLNIRGVGFEGNGHDEVSGEDEKDDGDLSAMEKKTMSLDAGTREGGLLGDSAVIEEKREKDASS
ncbi:MAG: polar growth protein [Pycnora praestabilis]|nr:MAG: polar growth protein [Pycnora praestabilis]